MKTFAAAALVAAVTATPMSNLEFNFINFVAKHGKNYGTVEEYQFRMELFAERDAEINRLNSIQSDSVHGHNKFSDFAPHEMKKMMGGRLDESEATDAVNVTNATPSFATGVNWVTVQPAVVNAVKDQGQCGSCWAFSSTSCLESAHAIATGQLLSFAEQQLVDCVKTCMGCNGGWQARAFTYYESHNAYLEADYQYTATDGTCTYQQSQASNVSVATFTKVTPSSVSALQDAVAMQPVSVSLDAETAYFQTYTSGVLTSAAECGTTIDHAVVAVGYGVEGGVNYWLVRNSWSASWGDQGYIKIAAQDGYGVCGIQSGPLYPTV